MRLYCCPTTTQEKPKFLSSTISRYQKLMCSFQHGSLTEPVLPEDIQKTEVLIQIYIPGNNNRG